MPSLSRRSFLGSSLRAGVGAAVLGVGGLDVTGRAGASPSAPLDPGSGLTPGFRPGEPPTTQRFVSRPDLTPPGVRIVRVADLAERPGQPRYIFATPRVAGPGQPAGSQGLMIMDLDGELVWFRSMPGTTNLPFDFQVQSYRGVPHLTWFQGRLLAGWGAGECVIADGAYGQVATVRAVGLDADLHEFHLTSEDTALITAYEEQPSHGVVSGHVQEIDLGSGDLRWSWSSYPAVPVSESLSNPGGDYFHINSIDLWPGTERNVLISARNTGTIYLISRRTREILWRVGGTKSDFVAGAGAIFSFQHDARPLADGSGISCFDDASAGTPERYSSGKVLDLYQATDPRYVELRHEYRHTGVAIDAGSQGNCQLLPSGGHLVGWGQVPYFTQFAASSSESAAQTLLDGRFPANIENYRAFLLDWTGAPATDELALVVRRAAGTGHFDAYASWNGATEVTHWQLEAGPSASSLAEVAVATRQGFETEIPVTRVGAKAFRVAALDRHGRVLGRSRVVA